MLMEKEILDLGWIFNWIHIIVYVKDTGTTTLLQLEKAGLNRYLS